MGGPPLWSPKRPEKLRPIKVEIVTRILGILGFKSRACAAQRYRPWEQGTRLRCRVHRRRFRRLVCTVSLLDVASGLRCFDSDDGLGTRGCRLRPCSGALFGSGAWAAIRFCCLALRWGASALGVRAPVLDVLQRRAAFRMEDDFLWLLGLHCLVLVP